jgi:fructose transport system permease protein
MSDPEQRVQDVARMESTAAAVTGVIEEEEWRAPSPLQRVQRTLHRYPALGPLLVLAIMMAVFALNSPEKFLSAGNISLVVQQMAVIGTLAVGQTLIILTAGVDLSVGAIAVFVSIIMANLSAEFGVPGIAALLLGFACGTAFGLLNGLLITRLRMPPFIVTLGTLSIFFALNLYVSSGATVLGSNMDSLLTLPGHIVSIGGANLTLGAIGMLVLYALFMYVLRLTGWGRHIYATGDDPESARLTGIRTDRVILSVYAVAGLTYAIGAWFLIGRVNAATPQALQTANLETITAVVIGGTSLFGGRGSVLGTLIGAMIVQTAINGLTIAGLDPLWQRFTIGVLVIFAVALDQWIRRVGK